MQYKTYYILLNIIALIALFSSVNVFSDYNSTSYNSTDIAHYLKEVTLTEDGVVHFFNCYNSSLYTKRFLPSCFLHVTDLLSYTKGQDDPYAYAYTIFSLFLNRAKGCCWVNPYALMQLLEKLPVVLSAITDRSQMRPEITKADIEKHIDDVLPLADNDRSLFIKELSERIYSDMQQMYALRDVQEILVRFLETILDKLVWDPEDEEVWDSFKNIGQSLELLYQKGLISDLETLNHLISSLVYRFGYFIELCGAALKIEWYNKVRADLANIAFLKYSDCESLAKTKTQYLLEMLPIGEVQARAYQRGVIT